MVADAHLAIKKERDDRTSYAPVHPALLVLNRRNQIVNPPALSNPLLPDKVPYIKKCVHALSW